MPEGDTIYRAARTLATALEGRGSQLGENLETVDSYLKRINPQIPALVEDLRLTAQVSDLYADILPEVAQILDDTIVTTGTLEEKEATLNSTLRDIRAFADSARGFLDRNDALIVEANRLVGGNAQPQMLLESLFVQWLRLAPALPGWR